MTKELSPRTESIESAGGGNDEVWDRRAQSFSKIIMIEYLTSIFVIPCSIFAFSEFLFRFDWTLASSGDAHIKVIISSS